MRKLYHIYYCDKTDTWQTYAIDISTLFSNRNNNNAGLQIVHSLGSWAWVSTMFWDNGRTGCSRMRWIYTNSLIFWGLAVVLLSPRTALRKLCLKALWLNTQISVKITKGKNTHFYSEETSRSWEPTNETIITKTKIINKRVPVAGSIVRSRPWKVSPE